MSQWTPIETAPKDGTKIDIAAKLWMSRTDTFAVSRFPSCHWWKGDSMCNRSAAWQGVDDGWRPTHWMPVPELPVV
jgi:hypothetical protein